MKVLEMQSSHFSEMLETVKAAIPTLIAVAPDNQFIPGITIEMSEDEELVRAKASSEHLTITTAWYDALEETTEGRFEVPASWVMNAKNRLPNMTVRLEQSEDDVLLKSGRFRTTSETVSVTQYQTKLPDAQTFEIPAEALIDSIPVASKTMGVNDYRYMINGVHFQCKKNTLTITGTNGHIGSRYATKIAGDELENFEFVIPRRSMLDVFALVKKHPDKNMNVSVSERNVEFDILDGGPTMLTTLLVGNFPDCDRLFKNNKINPPRVVFSTDRKEFVNTVQRVASLSKEGSNPAIVLKCPENGDHMTISLPEDNHNGRRKASDEVLIERAKDNTAEIDAMFNGQYLVDVLTPSNQEKATLLLAKQGSLETSIVDLGSGDPTVKVISPINL